MFLGCLGGGTGDGSCVGVSVNDHSRRIRLNEMVASGPVSDFWELRSSDDTNRWDKFAQRTGRSDITRRFGHGGMSCVWVRYLFLFSWLCVMSSKILKTVVRA